jgi:hypothetical protein
MKTVKFIYSLPNTYYKGKVVASVIFTSVPDIQFTFECHSDINFEKLVLVSYM